MKRLFSIMLALVLTCSAAWAQKFALPEGGYDGRRILLIEQTAPARHLSAFETPGRAMVFASQTTFRPSPYAELEFAAYGPDAEQTLTFRLSSSPETE